MTQLLAYHDNDLRSIYVHFRGRPLGEGVSGGPLIRLALETRDERIEVTNLAHAELAKPSTPRPRRPSIATLVKRAEKTGRTVASITTPDGTTIHFGEPEKNVNENPWDEVLPREPH